MTAPAPSVAVYGLLNGQTVTPPSPAIALALDVNLFRGPVRATTMPDSPAVPMTAVFVLGTGGERPKHLHDSTDELYANVAVTVRMEPNRFGDGEDLARGVWHVLQRNIPSGYIECHCLTSEPQYQGPTDNGSTEWLIPLQLIRVE